MATGLVGSSAVCALMDEIEMLGVGEGVKGEFVVLFRHNHLSSI